MVNVGDEWMSCAEREGGEGGREKGGEGEREAEEEMERGRGEGREREKEGLLAGQTACAAPPVHGFTPHHSNIRYSRKAAASTRRWNGCAPRGRALARTYLFPAACAEGTRRCHSVCGCHAPLFGLQGALLTGQTQAGAGRGRGGGGGASLYEGCRLLRAATRRAACSMHCACRMHCILSSVGVL